ncbi:hypothetical protein CANINC_000100 [Pichia inconspicua]|uniref:Uncharacterized protein n=1 Tax=Pichia inconspicua TaxID=52247 RepID=A0A4T0X8S7_9ASCO|nr:hypothetical protein CANINC_000100 [[Candida] inconspicua]
MSELVNRLNRSASAESNESVMELDDSEIHKSLNPDLQNIELVEKIVLNKVDQCLISLESKLSSIEKYLSQSAADVESSAKKFTPTYSSIRDTLNNVKSYLVKNKEHNLHPLTKIIDDYYEQENQNDTSYSSLLHSFQILNARLSDFEKHHNLPPFSTHPSERLMALKETLYNYDVALTVSEKRHLTFYELPFQWRENKFIVFGYRFAKSHLAALTSMFSWHNESINIWSHFLGASFMIYLGLYHYPNTDIYSIYGPSLQDHSIVYLYLTSAFICLMCSVIWHSYTNIGFLSVRSKFACFDYTGITILITSSIITTEHIALNDYPKLRISFIAFSVFAGIVGVGMAWHPFFDRPESRILRILFFVSLALLGLVSFLSSCFVHSVGYSVHIFVPILKSFLCYGLGVVFYGSFFPECFRTDVEIDDFEICDETILDLDKKGLLLEYLRKTPVHTCNHGVTSLWWVDWFGNSHNIWHIFVIGGILGHYFALLEMFKRSSQL